MKKIVYLNFDDGNLFFVFHQRIETYLSKKECCDNYSTKVLIFSTFMLLLSFQAITAACKWLLNGVEILANIGRTFFYPTWFWWPHLFWLSGWIGLQFLLEQSWVCTILYELRFLQSLQKLQSFTLWKTGKNMQW